MQTDACTALDWVAGLFFQSGRLLGLIMQAIATVIGADLGGFADEFGACFEESLFTFFHDVPPSRLSGNLNDTIIKDSHFFHKYRKAIHP